MPTKATDRMYALWTQWTNPAPLLEQKKKDGNKIPVQQFESNYNLASLKSDVKLM
jgi:hypothetical protein